MMIYYKYSNIDQISVLSVKILPNFHEKSSTGHELEIAIGYLGFCIYLRDRLRSPHHLDAIPGKEKNYGFY